MIWDRKVHLGDRPGSCKDTQRKSSGDLTGMNRAESPVEIFDDHLKGGFQCVGTEASRT